MPPRLVTKGDMASRRVLSVVFKILKCTSHLGIGLGAIAIRPGVCISHRLWEAAPCVQQTLNAIVERLLLLNMVVKHLGKAGAGRRGRVFENARFLNTSRRRTLPRAGGLMPMTTLPVTYGYARVSKSDDEAGNLETQLRLLADHGIRGDLTFSDIATGRTLRRAGWQELLSRLRPGEPWRWPSWTG